MAGIRLIRAVDAIAVPGPGTDAGDKSVKDLIGVFGQFEAMRLTVAVEQADFDFAGIGGKDCKIGAVANPLCSQRIGQSFFNGEIAHVKTPRRDWTNAVSVIVISLRMDWPILDEWPGKSSLKLKAFGEKFPS